MKSKIHYKSDQENKTCKNLDVPPRHLHHFLWDAIKDISDSVNIKIVVTYLLSSFPAPCLKTPAVLPDSLSLNPPRPPHPSSLFAQPHYLRDNP
uniref:Uncharacterized protein n=1 Tax=Uncultured archaeon GZfos26G2 TaxID=3386331 RepID=Q649L0_UNCAG|nr:hypothetical protein GZ34H9_35 [uncultured archaeon GZfos34H9]